MIRRSLLAALAVLFTLTAVIRSADWPQFRGPNRDDVSTDKGLLQSWPKDGPPLVWQAKGVGGGYSSLSIVGDRIYTCGNKNNLSHVFALERATGKVLWSAEIGPQGGDLGCTPTVDGEHVYALGQQGDLVCVEAAAGKRVWHRNVKKDFDGVIGSWNYCESPLVDGNQVIVTPGGKDATIVALNKKNGETVWKCAAPVKHHESGYSSAVVAEVGKVKHYVQLINGGLVGVATDGRFLWKYEKLGPNTANIPTPIVIGDQVFASAGYNKGGALLTLKADGENVSVEEVYFKQALTNRHGGVVRVGDHVYGDTDDSGYPFCAELKSGKVVWKRDRGQGEGEGSASVTYADGRLYFHYQNGVVALVDPSPSGGYKEHGSFKVPKTSGPCWAHPVVCDGRLYLREGDNIFCYDVQKPK
ncbi:MAG TPA: PQQ-binding-like beta-propeller repeat protein [Gemmataceae bacterium]|nr:PQQ-binding-like beta-propeller repeat protein [Gemmataceae bacterium]